MMMNGKQSGRSQDMDYNGRQNNYGSENADSRSYGERELRNGRAQEPNARVILEGYRRDDSNEGEKPRYNPLNTTRPQSSPLLNINDAIQIHLLVETALDDSKEFELLSQEEVDDLKKQIQTQDQRIEQTRRSLAIQSKYRDAAISMAKLYSPSDKKRSIDSRDSKTRRSLMGHKSQGSGSLGEAEQERIASERKCEELASELWNLEKTRMDSQSRLLRHTAGILQMTHKGPKKTHRTQGSGNQKNGMPGSPESMYTYSNARISIEPLNDELFFDERSFYKSADRLDSFDDLSARNSMLPKAQGDQMQLIALTEQKLQSLNNQLREVLVKVNPQRNASFGNPPLSSLDTKTPSTKAGDTLQSHLEYLERGLSTINQDHNQTLERHREVLESHQVILQNQQDSFRIESDAWKREQESMRQNHESMLNAQGSSRSLVDQEQASKYQQEIQRLQEESSKAQEESEAAMEETLQDMNEELHELILQYDPDRPQPPQSAGAGLQDQLSYFQDSVSFIREELAKVSASATRNSGNQGNLEQMETVMIGLWDIILYGEEEERQRKAERMQQRTAQNLPPDEDDMSGDDDGTANETFSLQGFSTKVQWLYTQATRLMDQKKVLKRQIKQQRELNSKSDATKDADIVSRQEELERTRALLTRTEMDSDEIRKQLSLVMERLDEAKQQEGLRDQSRASDESSAVRAVQAEVEERNQRITALEEELQDMQDEHSISNAEMQSKKADTESKISTLTQELAVAVAAHATSQSNIEQQKQAAEIKEKEADEMNMQLARLQTEVTFARAELEELQGTRSQRAQRAAAAEPAYNPATQEQIDELTMKNMNLSMELANLTSRPQSTPDAEGKAQLALLRKELKETIEEYEQMTKASIEWERERQNLEGEVDRLREEREGLEIKLGDEQVRWMGVMSPGTDGTPGTPMTPGLMPGSTSTSTTVLKNEFKKMMRDARAESARILKLEQTERRRVEDELRNLKKSIGPGRSGLSQSVGS